MRKYVTIPDIRQYPSYKQVNALRVYMHACMGMDLQTRNYAHSWRQLSAELCIPLQQVRTALKQLESDGLVSTQNVTQQVTYGLTQKVTHKVTQIHILSASELDEATNEATNSPTNSPSNSQTNSQSNSDNKNNNIPKSSNPTHTDARVKDEDLVRLAAKEFSISGSEAAALLEKFYRRQALKEKKWDGDGDKTAHFIAWCEKNMPRKSAPRKTEVQAWQDEYQRTKEVEASRSEEDLLKEECRDISRWLREGQAKLDKATTPEDKKKYTDYVCKMQDALEACRNKLNKLAS